MELRTLRSFLAVAREGNVTRAARALHITQPALSRQLSELEHELGCELLLRGSRGVTLTDEGMLLRKRAEEIVSLADRTELEIRSPGVEVEGDVWLGGGESRVMELVATTMARLSSRHPGIRLRLHSGNAEDVLERVEKGLLDFGILMGHEPPDRYEAIELPWHDRWGALLPKGHRLADRQELALEELRDEPLIVSTQSHPTQREQNPVFMYFEDNGYRIAATYTLLYNASLLVEQDVGVAICFDGIIHADEGSPFVFVPIVYAPTVPSYFVWKRLQPLSRACEVFLAELRDCVQQSG